MTTPAQDPSPEAVERLVDCPFCGHDEISDWGESTWTRTAHWMYCTLCGAQGPRLIVGRAESETDFRSRLVAAWNERAPRAEHADTLLSVAIADEADAMRDALAEGDKP